MVSIARGSGRKPLIFAAIAVLVVTLLAGGALSAFATETETESEEQSSKSAQVSVQEAVEVEEAKANEVSTEGEESPESASSESSASTEPSESSKSSETSEPEASSDSSAKSSASSSRGSTVTVQEASVAAEPTELSLIAGGEAQEVTLTLTDCTVDELSLSVVNPNVAKCSAITSEGTFTVTPLKKGKATVKVKKGSDEFAEVSVTVGMRLVTLAVANSNIEKAIFRAQAGNTSIAPTEKTDTQATYEVTAKQKLVCTVSSDYYEDATHTVAAGETDTSEEVELSPTEYKITYVLAGGTNAETNPSSYTVESDSITLANPTRENYAFEGWTFTGQTKPGKPVTITPGTGSDTAHSNLTFTANWRQLKDGMEVTIAGNSVAYDAEEHSLTFSSSNAGSIEVLYSADKGKTYTLEDMAYADAGEHSIYYKVSDNSEDPVYASVTGEAKLLITATDNATDATTGVIAQGNIFKKYTKNRRIVELDVVDLTNSTEITSHIADLKKKYFNSQTASLFKLYDVNLILEDKKNGTSENLTKDFGKLTLSFPVGSAYNGKSARIYELHKSGKKTKEIAFKGLKVNNGYVQATVTTLSEFVVVVDKTDTTTTKPNTTASSTAKTGDTVVPWIPICLAIIAIAVIVFAVIRIRKLR